MKMENIVRRFVVSVFATVLISFAVEIVLKSCAEIKNSARREMIFQFDEDERGFLQDVKEINVYYGKDGEYESWWRSVQLRPEADIAFPYRVFIPKNTSQVWVRCSLKPGVSKKQHVPQFKSLSIDGHEEKTLPYSNFKIADPFSGCRATIVPLECQIAELSFGWIIGVTLVCVGILLIVNGILDGAVMKFLEKNWELLLVALVVMYFLSYRLSAPFMFAHDDNSALFSSFARTHLTFGLGMTFGQDFFALRYPGELRPYLHHPPFVALWLAGWFKLTNVDTPAMVRACMGLMHFASFILFGVLSSMVIRNRIGRFFAVSVFALVPMGLFCGRMANHQVPGLLFFLLGVTASVWGCCYKTGRMRTWRWQTFLAIGWMGVSFSSWHALIATISFSIGFWFIIRGRPDERAFLRTASASLTVGIALVLLQLTVAKQCSGFGDNISEAVGWMGAKGNIVLTTIDNLKAGFVRGVDNYTPLPWYLFWAVSIYAIWKLFMLRQLSEGEKLILALAAGNMVYGIFFSKALVTHIYQVFYFLPALGLACGSFFAWVDIQFGRVGKWRKYTLLICFSIITFYMSYERLMELYRVPGGYARSQTQKIENSLL